MCYARRISSIKEVELTCSLEVLQQRVRSIMPHLKIEEFEVSYEGLVNDVVIVNEEYQS